MCHIQLESNRLHVEVTNYIVKVYIKRCATKLSPLWKQKYCRPTIFKSVVISTLSDSTITLSPYYRWVSEYSSVLNEKTHHPAAMVIQSENQVQTQAFSHECPLRLADICVESLRGKVLTIAFIFLPLVCQLSPSLNSTVDTVCLDYREEEITLLNAEKCMYGENKRRQILAFSLIPRHKTKQLTGN